MEPWQHMLDEFAIRPDPMPWWGVPARDLRMTLAEQHKAVVEDLFDQMGFLDIAGVRTQMEGAERAAVKDVLFALTPAGRRHWTRHVKGKRHRPKGAPPVPAASAARLALATGPREVFDLPRAPWVWFKTAEQLAEFGEAEETR